MTTYWRYSLALSSALILAFIGIGYAVTPLLFGALTEKLAGQLASVLFNGLLALSLVMLLIQLLVLWRALQQQFGQSVVNSKPLLFFKQAWSEILVAAILLFLASYLTPKMTEIKSQYSTEILRESPLWPQFAALHGVYQLVYLIVIVVLIVMFYRAWQNLAFNNHK